MAANIALADIAQRIGAEIIGDANLIIHGAGTIEDGQRGQIGFLAERRYARYATTTALSALIVSKRIDTPATQLLVHDVKAAWRQVAQQFARQRGQRGIHPAAMVDPQAKIGADVSIAAGAVIEPEAEIGAGCVIGANAVIEQGVCIGAQGYIGAGVQILQGTRIGARVFIDSGAVLGSRGFGYAFIDNTWQGIPQLGGVQVGDDVDIGANTTIDCGAIHDTVLEDGVKLDNLVHIGHNAHIGAHTIMAANCIVAGSVRLGRHCMVGGASVFAGHIHICDGAQFNGHSSVTKSISKADLYCSVLTVMPHKQWARFVGKLKLFGKEK